MIFQNGDIMFRQRAGDWCRLDSDGFVIDDRGPGDSDRGPIPCQWRRINQNLTGRVQGEHFALADYEVIIDLREDIKDPAEAELYDCNQREVVTREVKSLEHLKMVHRTKIYL